MPPSTGGSFLPQGDYNATGYWQIGHLGLIPTYYSASGTIPPVAGLALITKATAAAMVLAAPAVADDGDILVISSETAAAHTVTATALMNNGLSGSPWTTATFAAQKGAALTLLAANGAWNVLTTLGVVLT